VILGGLWRSASSAPSRAGWSAWGAAHDARLRRCYQAVNQGLGSVKEIKVLGREAYFVERFKRASLDTAV